MAKKHATTSLFRKRILCSITTSTLVFSMLPAFSFPALAASADPLPHLLKAGSVPVDSNLSTKTEPFPQGTGGSDYFRIPALTCLENGDLLAVADARYNALGADGAAPDGGGLDTIASVSSDGGKNWNYSFPIYFPDSSLNAGTKATTIIDPGIVEGPDGTVYCIADVNPTGVTTLTSQGYQAPGCGTGYVEINGTQRLALTSSFDKSNTRPDSSGADYEYYVGDFENGYAPVCNISDHTTSKYCVDEWLNIYETSSDGSRKELKQSQVDSSTQIQQNVFYKDSDLHVYKTGYLWMVSSTDHGRTWGNPTILNTQVKRNDDSNDQALLVSPGKGITTKSGDIAIGFYNWKPGRESASIVYSTDNGTTWHRTEDAATVAGTEIDTSSENEIVELEDGTLRMFFRHGGYKADVGNLCYVDAKKQADGSYRLQTPVATTISAHKGCNLSVLSYSKKINGKQVILVSVPSGVRANGQILTLLVNNDDNHTMTCTNRYSVPGGQGGYESFVYSCLTELEDGSIGLLWEPNHRSIRYNRFTLDENGIPSPYAAAVDAETEKGGAYTITDYKGAKQVTTAPDAEIAAITFPERTPVAMFDHLGNPVDNFTAFSDTQNNSLSLTNAEFTIADSENGTYTIKNDSTGLYLTNRTSETSNDLIGFFETTACNLEITKGGGSDTFRIATPGTGENNGSRYVMFFKTQTNFNVMPRLDASNSAFVYDLTLLEKDPSSTDGIIPGYKTAVQITSGKKYLIAYPDTSGKTAVLYPETQSINVDNRWYRRTKMVNPAYTFSIELFNHTGSETADIEAAFSEQPNGAIRLSDAEFVFETGSETDKWIIKNTAKNLFLSNASAAAFYASASAEMLVKKTTDNSASYFTISQAENSRIIFYYPPQTNFNSQGTGISAGADSKLTLLEKQSSVSKDDIIPGYKKADTITSGKSYLIAYRHTSGKLLILYPDNTADNFYTKTKLVACTEKDNSPVTDLVITGVGEGYTKAVIDGTTYHIQVTETHPALDPACGHTETVLKNVKEADCETNGYSGDKICAGCNGIVEAGVLLTGGHDWDDGTVTKNVTKTEDGIRELTCKRNTAHKKTQTIYASAYSVFMDAYEEINALMETVKENPGLYEDETAEALQAAYDAAKTTAETGNSSRSDMYRLKADLLQAKSNLRTKSLELLTNDLNDAIRQADADAGAGQGNLPAEIWTEFKTAYDNAKKPIPDGLTDEAKAKYILDLTKALTTAQQKLDDAKDSLNDQALAAAKNNLATAVQNAKTVYDKDKNLYTPESWRVFETAYNAAKNPPADADLHTLQTLLSNLNHARSKLVKVSSPGSSGSENNGDPNPSQTNSAPVYDDITYKVLDESKKTASAVTCGNKTIQKAKILDTVIINKKTYRVVQINAKAFLGCTKLKQVTIGKHVTIIGKQCFSGCKKLNKITLTGTKLKTFKSGAFKKTSAKMTVKVPKKMKSAQRKALLRKMKKVGMSKKAKIK